MTFEPSASQAQIDARQHAFDNQPDPATLVSREEIRAALLDRHTAATQDKLDAAHVAICGLRRPGLHHRGGADPHRRRPPALDRLRPRGYDESESPAVFPEGPRPVQDGGAAQQSAPDQPVHGHHHRHRQGDRRERADAVRKRGHHLRGVRRAGKQDDARQRGAGESAGQEARQRVRHGRLPQPNLVSTRRVSKNFYFCGDGETAPVPGAGLMAPRVGVVACHEANMITRLILGEEDA